MTQEDPALERAKKHVKEVSDFFYHLMTYVLVNALMVIIDRRGGANDTFGLDWAYWLIIGWGFGIAGHAVSVFYSDYKVHKLYQEEQERQRQDR